ncbi:MAG: DOMON domain-containing protein [Salibacteraceae bacterium]
MKAILLIATLFTFLVGNNSSYQQYNDDYKQINSNGITFRWKSEGGSLKCQVKAPTPGWVSVGFKNSRGLILSNQIMGCFRDGQSFCEDRYMVNLREKTLVEELGGNIAIEEFEILENNGITEMYFTIASTPFDGYHYNLNEGEPVFVSLGFSRSDDFEQRAVMQFEAKITI